MLGWVYGLLISFLGLLGASLQAQNLAKPKFRDAYFVDKGKPISETLNKQDTFRLYVYKKWTTAKSPDLRPLRHKGKRVLATLIVTYAPTKGINGYFPPKTLKLHTAGQENDFDLNFEIQDLDAHFLPYLLRKGASNQTKIAFLNGCLFVQSPSDYPNEPQLRILTTQKIRFSPILAVGALTEAERAFKAHEKLAIKQELLDTEKFASEIDARKNAQKAALAQAQAATIDQQKKLYTLKDKKVQSLKIIAPDTIFFGEQNQLILQAILADGQVVSTQAGMLWEEFEIFTNLGKIREGKISDLKLQSVLAANETLHISVKSLQHPHLFDSVKVPICLARGAFTKAYNFSGRNGLPGTEGQKGASIRVSQSSQGTAGTVGEAGKAGANGKDVSIAFSKLETPRGLWIIGQVQTTDFSETFISKGKPTLSLISNGGRGGQGGEGGQAGDMTTHTNGDCKTKVVSGQAGDGGDGGQGGDAGNIRIQTDPTLSEEAYEVLVESLKGGLGGEGGAGGEISQCACFWRQRDRAAQSSYKGKQGAAGASGKNGKISKETKTVLIRID